MGVALGAYMPENGLIREFRPDGVYAAPASQREERFGPPRHCHAGNHLGVHGAIFIKHVAHLRVTVGGQESEAVGPAVARGERVGAMCLTPGSGSVAASGPGGTDEGIVTAAVEIVVILERSAFVRE